MILIKLNRKVKDSLYIQIFNQIKGLIEKGVLKVGAKLPSTRSLSEKLGVNRSTVYNAYQELWAMGYINSTPGSYSRVRKRHQIVTINNRLKKGMLSWEELSTLSSNSVYETYLGFNPESIGKKRSDMINLAQLDMDHRLFPVDDFKRCLNQAFIKEGAPMLGYGEHAGYRPLREYIGKRLQMHGISVSSDEILITNGSQNGIDLVLRMLTVAGKKIAIESPTYAIILPLLKYYSAEVKGIPMTDKGIDLEYLQTVLEKEQISFLYTMPNFHNPTGITTEQSHRETLLSICERYHIPIVEDGFEEEMKYFGKVSLPIKSMDKHQIVIYLGTFSKVLFPGIRVGWIAAEKECVQRLLSLKRFSDLSSNSVAQAAVLEFCKQGYYDLHIRRMHRTFRKRMQTALKSLKQYLPQKNISWTEPVGGYLIWVQMKGLKFDQNELKEIFQKNGVNVSPGEFYFHRKDPENHFRISISTLNETEIEEGIRRLGESIHQIYR